MKNQPWVEIHTCSAVSRAISPATVESRLPRSARLIRAPTVPAGTGRPSHAATVGVRSVRVTMPGRLVAEESSRPSAKPGPLTTTDMRCGGPAGAWP